jgi:hypothetical protein
VTRGGAESTGQQRSKRDGDRTALRRALDRNGAHAPDAPNATATGQHPVARFPPPSPRLDFDETDGRYRSSKVHQEEGDRFSGINRERK